MGLFALRWRVAAKRGAVNKELPSALRSDSPLLTCHSTKIPLLLILTASSRYPWRCAIREGKRGSARNAFHATLTQSLPANRNLLGSRGGGLLAYHSRLAP